MTIHKTSRKYERERESVSQSPRLEAVSVMKKANSSGKVDG